MATYSVSETLRRAQHTGTGGAGPFAFSFQANATSDLRVLVDATQKTLTTHYTVSLSADGTGSVSFTSGNEPTTSEKITLLAKTPLGRTSVYTTGGSLTAASLESDHDTQVMLLQQLQEQVKRSVQLAPETQRVLTGVDGTTTGPLMFPYSNTVADNASNVIAFDIAGTALTATQELGEFQGNWAASNAYVLRDLVKDTDNNSIYICVTAHTSSGSAPLSTNTDSAKWSLIVDAASATTSQTAAATSATAAATSATAAATSATASATSATASATSATASASSATGAASSASTATTQASNASTSATAAAASDTAAANSVSAVGLQFTFDNSTSMADPGTAGDFRLNHATVASVTAIAFDATSADTGNPDVSDFIATWDDSTSTLNGHLILKKKGTPATFAIFTVGAVTDNTGWLQVALTHVDSAGSWSAADVCYLQFIRIGDKGDTGSTGSTGSTGLTGNSAGLLMAFESATTDTDQGSGKVWLNNSAASATVLYMDDLEAGGASINALVDTWDDSTTTAARGTISIYKNSAPENFHIFTVSGVVTSASTYSKIACTFVQTSGTISDGDAVSVQFQRSGNTGAAGSGTGDLLAANNLNDVAAAATAFTNIKQDASTSATGVSEHATTAETVTGTDSARVVTPAGLHGALAGLTDTVVTASDTFVFADATDSNALKEDTVAGIIDLVPDSSASAKGIVELSTDAESISGSDTARAVTPANLSARLTNDIGSSIQAHDSDTTKNDANNTFTLAQRGSITTLADGANISSDHNNNNYFTVTLAGNRVLDNPSNPTAGQSGSIFVVQDGSGSRTLSYGSYWDWPAGAAPTLTTTANMVDRIDYVVRSSTSIHCVWTGDVR